MSSDKPATPEGVLGRRPPELRELVEGLRLLVKEAATGASERAHSGRNNLLYAYQGTDFCYIQPHKRGVNLGFPHGTSHSDPTGLWKARANRCAT